MPENLERAYPKHIVSIWYRENVLRPLLGAFIIFLIRFPIFIFFLTTRSLLDNRIFDPAEFCLAISFVYLEFRDNLNRIDKKEKEDIDQYQKEDIKHTKMDIEAFGLYYLVFSAVMVFVDYFAKNCSIGIIQKFDNALYIFTIGAFFYALYYFRRIEEKLRLSLINE